MVPQVPFFHILLRKLMDIGHRPPAVQRDAQRKEKMMSELDDAIVSYYGDDGLIGTTDQRQLQSLLKITRSSLELAKISNDLADATKELLEALNAKDIKHG